MSCKMFVSAACSTLPRILRPHIILNSKSPCYYAPVVTGTKFTSIRYMSTAEGNSKTSPSIPKSVPVQVAHKLLQSGYHYLDVRTDEEFKAGHAVGAINVPFLLKASSGMTKNPNFLEGVSANFAKEDEIVVGCQTGRRSLMAAADMISAGYSEAIDVAGGYVAWTQMGFQLSHNTGFVGLNIF